MTPPRTVLLAGATGLVGRELLRGLLDDGATVHAVVRRRPPDAHPEARLHWLPVDFAALPSLPAADEAYCALGTTIAVAGSPQAFRAVDFDAVLAFARGARAAGVRRFAVVSALGADARSATFYNRVKGEAEEALRSVGFAHLVIARPSLLAGDRASLGQPARRGEALALRLTAPLAPLIPAAWRPIQAATVARALRRALHDATAGVQVLSSAQLQTLGHPRGNPP